MFHDVVTYLQDTEVKQCRGRPDAFGSAAIVRLCRSNAFQRRDRRALRQLAEDLINENRGTIRVARKYPEIFSAQLVRSRECENAIYQQVIALLDRASAQ